MENKDVGFTTFLFSIIPTSLFYYLQMALNGICIRVEAQYLREASSLLWRISNNMNQYARKANATGSIYLEDINSMKTKYDELIQVYGNVLQQFNEIAEVIY